MDREEDTWRKTLCIGVLLVNTWSVFLTFRQIHYVANANQVPDELSRKINQADFDVYRNFAVIGLIGKVFEYLRVTIITIMRIVRGYPAWLWSLTSDYEHIVGNRVVCYTIVETVLANWLAVLLVNLGMLLSGNISGAIAFNAMVAAVLLVSASLTYLLVISTKLLGPSVLLYIAVPMNVLEMLNIVLLIQFVLPSFCHSLPKQAAYALNPTAELVNYPVSKICMIPESNGEFGANAAFIGVWGYKMIIITESLLNTVGLTDAPSVLAHELGHWVRGHMFFLVASHLLQTLLSCFLLALCYGNDLLFGVFKFDASDPPHPAIGVLVGLQFVVPLFAGVVKGFTTMLTYFNEYQADHFAVNMGLGLGLKNALLTLVGATKQFSLYDSWFAAWFVGHPDVLDRVHRVLHDIR